MRAKSGHGAKSKKNEQMSIKSVIRGIVYSYIVTIPVFILFALILTNTDFPDQYISTTVFITTIISILVAGIVSTRSFRNKGWLNGAIVGFIYVFILYLIGSLYLKNFIIDKQVLNMCIVGILTGSIGGIIGINLKRSHVK